MQSAILFAGIRGPDRKVACIDYPTSGIPIEAKMADYIRPTLAEPSNTGDLIFMVNEVFWLDFNHVCLKLYFVSDPASAPEGMFSDE